VIEILERLRFCEGTIPLPYYSESSPFLVDTVGTWIAMVGLLLQALGLRLLQIKPQLPKSGCLPRVDSRLQIGFFQEITPACASVFLALAPFEVVESPLRALRSFDDGHDPTRNVGLLVEPNDRKRVLRVVCHFLVSESEIRTDKHVAIGWSARNPTSHACFMNALAQKTRRSQNTFLNGFGKWPLGVVA
jgi:hypothetical protein